ncbi:MAG TPA: DM13 domain-containing protein, partial [Tepidisphaeraceae bacterium]|nr:DM13 domain-containing protein [Tepidisphaeraceae bacterium]
KGSGSAYLFRGPGGKPALRIANLRTAMRPDLVVYLVSARDAFDNETVTSSRILSLGNLHGDAANQVYPLPLGIDPRQFHSVTIWSRQYRVNFTTAPLVSTRE